MNFPKKRTSLPSKNPFLFHIPLDLNTSLLSSHPLIDPPNLSTELFILTLSYLLALARYYFRTLNAKKGVSGGVLRTIP